MVRIRIVVSQQQGAPATAVAPAQPAAPNAAELKEQIRQGVQSASDAAQSANGASRVIIGKDGIIIGPDAQGRAGVSIPGNDLNNVIPSQAVDISVAFFVMCAVMVIGWPIARAFGRRIERRGQVTALDAASSGQLQRIEQSIEAMAIEIERISESQRFMARLQSGAGGREHAQPTLEQR